MLEMEKGGEKDYRLRKLVASDVSEDPIGARGG